MEFFNQLFCKHSYQEQGRIKSTYECSNGEIINVPVVFCECAKCNKRIVIRDNDCFYSESFKQQMALWKKRQLELKLDREQKG